MQIAELKQRICDAVEGEPMPSQQRLIHSGKICLDSKTLKDVLTTHDLALPQILHLVRNPY